MNRNDSAQKLPTLREVLKHQIALVIATMVVILGLAVLYVIASPATYTSSSVVLLGPAPGNPLTPEVASGNVSQLTVALETEARLVPTPAVVAAASEIAGEELPHSSQVLTVAVQSNTQMLEIEYAANTPEKAQAGAQAFADGYLEVRANRADATQAAQIERIRQQIEASDADLQQAIAEAAGEEGTHAAQQVPLYADRLAQLGNALSAAETVSTDPGTVISSAELPEGSDDLPAWMVLTGAALMALVIGLGLGFVREWRKDLIRGADQWDDRGIAVLATLPPSADNPVVLDRQAYECYRQLRTAVLANAPKPFVVGVADIGADRGNADGGASVGGGGGGGGAGASGAEAGDNISDARAAHVATNLAIVLTEARFSVLLIIANSASERIEKLLDAGADTADAATAGLAEVIFEGLPVERALVHTHGLTLLGMGASASSRSDLTATPEFRSTVSELHGQFDYVVVATSSSASAQGEAALLAVDAALLVLDPGSTTHALLDATLARSERLSIRRLGAVLQAAGPAPASDGRNARSSARARRRMAEHHYDGEVASNVGR